ncbi:hypothetical protein GCM10009533_01090 [Saccharopolyspora spinosporotrichia]|uniref:Uncharacterized protein n=1 Tax=Saccharopolyspora erythraea TaxID=1836 RepID=A0ABN1BUW1_SACER
MSNGLNDLWCAVSERANTAPCPLAALSHWIADSRMLAAARIARPISDTSHDYVQAIAIRAEWVCRTCGCGRCYTGGLGHGFGGFGVVLGVCGASACGDGLGEGGVRGT